MAVHAGEGAGKGEHSSITDGNTKWYSPCTSIADWSAKLHPVHPLLMGVQNGTPCTSIADGSTKWYNPCGNQCGASSKSLKTDQL